MLKNRKEDIERVAIEMFREINIDIEDLNRYTEKLAYPLSGKETTIDIEFNGITCSIRNASPFDRELNAKETGILNGCTILLSYALSLYYRSYDFESSIDALDDCIEILKTIDSNLELIKDIIWGYKTHTELINEIEKEKLSLIKKINFSNESEEIENDIINSLFA